jgi:hypothetical protein
LGLLYALDGCRPGYEECRPGEVRSCPTQICSGEQTCDESGFFGACDCTGTGGFTGVGGSRAVGGASGVLGVGGFGGSLGRGGSAGKGGTLGFGGSKGGGGGSLGSDSGAPGGLGRACTDNNQCLVGLECVLPLSGKLGGAGPAKGYCTAPCVPSATINDCAQFGATAVCYDFASSPATSDGGTRAEAYCLEGCNFGPLGLGNFDQNKCHGRRELACSPVLTRLGRSCTADRDCATGDVCKDLECQKVRPACRPLCNDNADCGPGLFCNPGDGLCRAGVPQGKAMGQECTPVADGGADGCRGDCEAFESTSSPPAHACVEHCTIGALPSCGWSGVPSSGPAPALCIIPSTLVIDRGGPGIGDLAACAPLCDCNRDCAHPAFVCRDLANPSVQQAVRRRGFCSTPVASDGGIEAGIACD